MIHDANFPEHLLTWLRKVRYKDWWLECTTGQDGFYIEWHAPIICVHTGDPKVLSSRPQYLRRDIGEGELARLAYNMIGGMEDHERGEHFLYGDLRPFDPHHVPGVSDPAGV